MANFETKDKKRPERIAELDRFTRNERKRAEKSYAKNGKRIRMEAEGALLRRRRMTSKTRKAVDFILGLRPPRPWYYPGSGKAYAKGSTFDGIFPRWDEAERRKAAAPLQLVLNAKPIMHPVWERSFMEKLKGFVKHAFRKPAQA